MVQKKRFLQNKNYNNSKGKIEINFGISRINIISFIIMTLFGVIIIKLFFIQIIKYDYYKEKASAYQDLIEKIPAKRLRICFLRLVLLF